MALRKPLVVVSGQVQEIPTGDSPWTFTIGIGDASNAAASTQFVANAMGRGLIKDVGSGGTTTLNATEAANTIITVTGALTSNAILEVPITSFRTYVVSNETTGAFSLSIKQASASPVAAVARGKRNIVVAVGNGVYDALTDFESIVLTGIPLAPTMPTSSNGFEIANTAFVKAAIAASGSGGSEQILEVRDEKTSGTQPQYGNSISFVQRELNTVGYNSIAGASLSANSITLPAGTYHVAARSPGPSNAGQAGRNAARLTNASSQLLVMGSVAGTDGDSWVMGVFTLAATTQVQLQHRTTDSYRLGSPGSFGVPEVYAEIVLRKIA